MIALLATARAMLDATPATLNRIRQRHLEIERRLVSGDPNLAEAFQDGANILVLEFD